MMEAKNKNERWALILGRLKWVADNAPHTSQIIQGVATGNVARDARECYEGILQLVGMTEDDIDDLHKEMAARAQAEKEDEKAKSEEEAAE